MTCLSRTFFSKRTSPELPPPCDIRDKDASSFSMEQNECERCAVVTGVTEVAQVLSHLSQGFTANRLELLIS